MASYIIPVCLFVAFLAVVSAAPADEKPFDCPPGEKYYKCDLEVCYKTCEHLEHPPPCPSIAAGCFKPSCQCENDNLRNSEGKCVPYKDCGVESAAVPYYIEAF